MVTIKHLSFDDVEFRGEASILNKVHFYECSFKGADFRHAILTDAVFTRCSLDRASFLEVSAENVRLESCSVRYTDWTGANLTRIVCIKDANETSPENDNELIEEEKKRKSIIEGQGINLLQSGHCPELSFRDSAFRNADLSGAILIGCDFTGANFQSARLHSTCLRNSQLTRSVLSDASFGWEDDFAPNCRVNICDCAHSTGACKYRFQNTRFDEAHARRADFENAVFHRSSFAHTDLQRAILTRCDFDRAQMAGALLSNTLAENCILREVDLTGAVLREIQFKGSKFLSNDSSSGGDGGGGRCKLIGVDASGADFSNTYLQLVKANAARFYAATFEKADLSRAIVEGAIFERSDLTGANLREIMAEDANFSQVQLSRDTVMEKGLFSFTTFSGATFPAGIAISDAEFRSAVMDGVAFGLNEGALSVTNITSVNFYDANLAGAVFCSGCMLEDVNFRDANLTSVSFGPPEDDNNNELVDAKFNSITLKYCDLSDARIDRSRWRRAEVLRCSFSNCTWNSSSVSSSSFLSCKFNRVEIRSSDLSDTQFYCCLFLVSDFIGSVLKRVTISCHNEDKTTEHVNQTVPDKAIKLCKFSETAWIDCTIEGNESKPLLYLQCSFRGALFKDCNLRKLGFQLCDFSEAAVGATLYNVAHFRGIYNLASLTGLKALDGFIVYIGCSFEVTPLPQNMGQIILYRCELIGDGVLPPREDGNGDHPIENLPFLFDCTIRNMSLPTWYIDRQDHIAQVHQLRNIASRILSITTNHSYSEKSKDVIESIIQAYRMFGRRPHMQELKALRDSEPRNLIHYFTSQFWHSLRDNFIGVGETNRVDACVKEYRYHQLLSAKNDYFPLRFRWPKSDQCMGTMWCATHFGVWAFIVVTIFALGSSVAIRGNIGITLFSFISILSLSATFYCSCSFKTHLGYLSLIVFQFGEGARLILFNGMLLIMFFAFAYWGVSNLGTGSIIVPSSVSQDQLIDYKGNLEMEGAPATIISKGNILLEGCGVKKSMSGCNNNGRQDVDNAKEFSMLASVATEGKLTLQSTGMVKGTVELEAPKSETTQPGFLECLYFSAVTFTTLGYGDMRPVGTLRFLAAVESLIGAFAMALFVYAFTRGTAER